MPMRPRSGRDRVAPQKIMVQLLGAGMLEAEHLATLWIDTGHKVPDGAVLPGGIHRLKNEQHSIAIRRVEKLLQR